MFVTSTFSVIRSMSLWSYFHALAILPYILKIVSWNNASIRFLTAVVRASFGSYVGKPSSAYGWSGGFSPGFRFSPTFDERSARYKWNILERAVKPKSKKKKKKKKKKKSWNNAILGLMVLCDTTIDGTTNVGHLDLISWSSNFNFIIH